jgi:Domain of unknown function (DUF4397)
VTSAIRTFTGAAAVLASVVALPAAATAAEHAASPTDQVYLVQGVPGSAVDVSVDGDTVKAGLEAKGIVGPLALTPGKHAVTFSAKGWTVKSMVTISHASSDIVVHWPADEAQQPVVTVFNNDVAPVGPDKGRLTVAHTAVVPPADIRVDNKVLFANIANGEYVTSEVPGGTYSVEVVPTGETNALLGPVDLPVKTGVLTRVFAIGEPSNGSMDAIVQVLPVGDSGSATPGSVDAGAAGLVATSTPSSDHGSGLALPAAAGGLMALAALAVVGRRRRAAR